MSAIQFTPENITAILQAASKGTSYRDVIRISGVNVNLAVLHNWLSKGKRDEGTGETTAYVMFYQAWHRARKSAPKAARPDSVDRHDQQMRAVMEVIREMEGN